MSEEYENEDLEQEPGEWSPMQIQIPDDDIDDDDEEDNFIQEVNRKKRSRPNRGNGLYGV